MKNNASYSDLKVAFDEVVERLQDEQIDIDEATKLYTEGQKLIRELEEYLKDAEAKVKKINSSKQ